MVIYGIAAIIELMELMELMASQLTYFMNLVMANFSENFRLFCRFLVDSSNYLIFCFLEFVFKLAFCPKIDVIINILNLLQMNLNRC